MRIIDTHSHIYSKEFNHDRTEIITAAKKAGVCAVLLPNEDSGSIEAIHKLSDEEPDFAFPMMGLHPTSVNMGYIKELQTIETALTKRPYYAIGEIGIDLYWDRSYLKEQKIVFEEQLRWSIDMRLPVAIHIREALDEALDSIYKVGADRLRGVFHCFGGTAREWKEIAELSSFYAGIGGIITFNKNELKETLRHIPVKRVLLETDAPYLAPVPYRGKRNEPAYIIEIAKKVAECYKMTTDAIATYTFQNSLDLFNIPINNVDVEVFQYCTRDKTG
ncbi:MAG: TatD family hydrolase [Tannerella sp.]|jgi:TatD DNase family protein|nr:TatD family hydrolase [Tannerella sp.]